MRDSDKSLKCPLCRGRAERIVGGTVNIRVWKPLTLEHMSSEPMTFYSKQQLRDECKKRGVESGALL